MARKRARRPSGPVAVALGLIVREGQVLLLRRERDPYGGLWSLPGGKAEPEEGLEDAARRELREELGWEVAVEGLALLVHERLLGQGEWLLAIFRCGAGAEEAPPGCAWFPLASLDALADMIPTDRHFIADALASVAGPAPVRRAVVAPGPRLLSYG